MSKSEERAQEMLNHMYEKYGIEFQVDWAAETLFAHSYDSWNCSVKGKEDDDKGSIVVHGWRNKKQEPYVDTYFSKLISVEVEKRVKEVLKGELEAYKAYVYGNDFVDNEYHCLEDFELYLKKIGNDSADYTVKILVPDEGDEQANRILVEKILRKLREANIGNAYVNIFCMEEDVFRTRTRENTKKLIKKMNGKLMYKYRYGGDVYEWH